MDTLFQELVLISLGKKDSFSVIPSDKDWETLYATADKQSLIGVLFSGVERLPSNQRPPIEILIDWVGQADYIKSHNALVSARAAEVYKLFSEGGFPSVLLKGQGVALLYPQPELRAAGDVDLWVKGRRDSVIRFLKEKGWKVGRTVIHHTDVEIFPDISVEVHHVPSYTFSPIRYLKYKRWFRKQAKTQFQLFDGNVGFAHPTIGFNTVYSLLHIFRHVFHEGIGLRQLLDYYYILTHATETDRSSAIETLRWFGLAEFAAAVMYVEKTVFGIEDKYLLCDPSEKSGRFLLAEIERSGNFGKYDDRITAAHKGSLLRLYFSNVVRLFKMVRYYPSEVLWAPIWKPVHFVWRKVKGY